MEIHKQKREIIQAANPMTMRYPIILFLVLVAYTSRAQIPNGRYIYSQPDLGLELRFEGKRFTSLSFQHDTVKGSGTYEIKDNTLFLHYDKARQDTSRYVIDQRKEGNSAAGMIMLEVYDGGNTNLPFYFAASVLQDKAGATVAQNYTDTLGKASFSIHNDKAIDRVRIVAPGYHSVTLPVSRLMGYTTALKVYLKPVQERTVSGSMVTYTINTLSGDNLVLIAADGSKLRFKKVRGNK
jgi:hypothetical protein